MVEALNDERDSDDDEMESVVKAGDAKAKI